MITQIGLALTLKFQGQFSTSEKAKQLLGESVEAFRAVAAVYDREQSPEAWAKAQNDVASALYEQGTRTEGEAGQQLLEESIKHTRLALEIYTEEHFPDEWKQTNQNLAKALNVLGYQWGEEPERYVDAKKLLEEAVTIAPEEPAYYDNLGWVEYRLGNLKSAEKHLQQAFKGSPHPEHARHLIEVLWKQDKTTEAEKLLTEMLEKHPDDELLLAVKKRMSNPPNQTVSKP